MTVGNLLGQAWSLKRSFANGITSELIDRISAVCLNLGASGGKLLGAGGAGFFLVFIDPLRSKDLLDYLEKNEMRYEPVVLSSHGLKTWTSRI